ncbi:hypothetical protein ACFZAR_05435 [Streptomyces sp. NPDC008222]|uniref:hypothetical protein n=1 Tax=Streptomyces sp. NPDC008222 TaxID=3364820 RepID=UPI0036EAF427
MTTDQPLDLDRLTEIEESHPGDWYAGEWRSEYVDSTTDQPAHYRVKHQESGHVLAELPDFAGGIALFIADAHDAVPGMAAEIRRLRAELAAEQAQHATTLRQRNNRSERLLHLRDLANAGDTEQLVAAARDALAASVNDHR